MKTAEQHAREMLVRMGYSSAAHASAGHLIELANLINNASRFKPDVAYMPVPRCETCAAWTPHHGYSTCDYALDKDAKMFTADADDGRIITMANFGCVSWKAKS